jgi:uncharacterized membrane protein (DUF2068 family)
MAVLAAITLTWPGTVLDQAWMLNPRAHDRLIAWGSRAGTIFFLLAVVLASCAVGWLGRKRWGWWMAVLIISIHMTTDLITLIFGKVIEGLLGVVIASALLIYLLRAPVRLYFRLRVESVIGNRR